MSIHSERALESLERVARRCVGDPLWRCWCSGESVWNLGFHVQMNGRERGVKPRLRATFPSRKWISGSSWSTAVCFVFSTEYRTCAAGVKPPKPRRNAKRDDCATPLGIPNHLFTTKQGGWLAGQTRPDLRLPRQSGTAVHGKHHCEGDSESHCVGSSSSSICRIEIDVF